MPQYLLFTSFLLISHLTTHGRANQAITYTITDNDLRHHCDFELNGYSYNLCPLMTKTMLVDGTGVVLNEDEDRGEGSSSGRRFYEVALGGLDSSSQARTISKSVSSECDANTWVCLLDMAYAAEESVNSQGVRRPALAVPIARKVRKSRKKCDLKATATIDIEENGSESRLSPLRLSLNGGRREKKAQSAEFAFLCAEGESIRFIGEERGVHSFMWATPHGCPTKVLPSIHPGISVAEEQEQEGGNEEPAPEEKTDGDDDLLPPSKSKTRRWIAIIIVVFATGLVGGSILISSTRARHLANDNLKGFGNTVVPLLAQATTMLRPIGNSIHNLTSKSLGRLASFRQGDSQLVRWAQEDMSLTDSEDVMVNGSGAYDRYDSQGESWDASGLDEYIPLTISPKYGKGRRVRSYGATPDVETFEERGIMTGLTKYFDK